MQPVLVSVSANIRQVFQHFYVLSFDWFWHGQLPSHEQEKPMLLFWVQLLLLAVLGELNH